MKEGEGKEGNLSFLSSPPPPRLLAPFFARPLLRNSTETLASQAICGINLDLINLGAQCRLG